MRNEAKIPDMTEMDNHSAEKENYRKLQVYVRITTYTSAQLEGTLLRSPEPDYVGF